MFRALVGAIRPSLKIMIISTIIIWNSNSLLALEHLEGLATPEGATIVAVVYGVGSGIGNFMWAFNWHEHLGINETIHAQLQEAGGLTASALCILLGVVPPVMLYLYNRKHAPKPEEEPNHNLEIAVGK